MRCGKISIIGVGLLGGSLGLAIRENKLARPVFGYVRRRASLAQSVRAGAVDVASLILSEVVEEADLVVLCTPIAQMEPLVRQMLPSLKRGAIVTDVGSVKTPLVRRLGPLVRKSGAHFVGSHPMAGSEKMGVKASCAGLFEGAVCVVTPDGETNPQALRKVRSFWRALGARVIQMEPALHDQLVARSSHLPHLVAAILARQVLDSRHPKQQRELCATGFRDTTRVAASSASMWRDIVLANRNNLVREVKRMELDLRRFRRMLSQSDAAAIEGLLAEASERRQSWRPKLRPCDTE